MPPFELPEIENPKDVPTGDMPGDKIEIGEKHIQKAQAIFPKLWELLQEHFRDQKRVVIAVHGGSGVGKSETGSLIAHYLRHNGIGSYVMSGDNYPRRIPRNNDAERLRIFRTGALRALAAGGDYDDHVRATLADLCARELDADRELLTAHPWLAEYQRAGRQALREYLGTPREVDFDEVNRLLAEFHAGAEELLLKRLGREESARWYDAVDMRGIKALVIEWTHGNNEHVQGVDIPILLNSTPAETLAHRLSRARDKAVDSPFTTLVLELEQERLHSRASKAKIIVNKANQLIDYRGYLKAMDKDLPEPGVMLNLYPDSLGGTLRGLTELLHQPAARGAFSSVYLLPSVFNSDLDRGFSVIDYELNELYASAADFETLDKLAISLKFDFVLNHASVLSPQFQDLLDHGDSSAYKDFFIDWNAFWEGHGSMTEAGYIQPEPALIEDMFFRKPGLPILMVRMPDGSKRPYWNTFYQEVRYDAPTPREVMDRTGRQYASAKELADRIQATLSAGRPPEDIDMSGFEAIAEEVIDWVDSRRSYLGQMDLNIKSPEVWAFYAGTLEKLAGYGAQIVRLDAFAYAPKEPGAKNFMNDPGTWELLDKVRGLAEDNNLLLLPEIHSKYEEKTHEKLSQLGYLTYDFFLPGLLIDALHRADATALAGWFQELLDKQIHTVNMLGCHDGIPLLDLKGLLPNERIESLIELVKSRGGYVKDLHGKKQMYYQVNATYFSALGASEQALLLARAIQMFAPGKPQVWYLDLFAGENDMAAVERAGPGGHKEINRTNLSAEAALAGLERPVVARQLALIYFRTNSPAFGWDAKQTISQPSPEQLVIRWEKEEHSAELHANLAELSFSVSADGAPVEI